jgi:hypothetical protein
VDSSRLQRYSQARSAHFFCCQPFFSTADVVLTLAWLQDRNMSNNDIKLLNMLIKGEFVFLCDGSKAYRPAPGPPDLGVSVFRFLTRLTLLLTDYLCVDDLQALRQAMKKALEMIEKDPTDDSIPELDKELFNAIYSPRLDLEAMEQVRRSSFRIPRKEKASAGHHLTLCLTQIGSRVLKKLQLAPRKKPTLFTFQTFWDRVSEEHTTYRRDYPESYDIDIFDTGLDAEMIPWELPEIKSFEPGYNVQGLAAPDSSSSSSRAANPPPIDTSAVAATAALTLPALAPKPTVEPLDIQSMIDRARLYLASRAAKRSVFDDEDVELDKAVDNDDQNEDDLDFGEEKDGEYQDDQQNADDDYEYDQENLYDQDDLEDQAQEPTFPKVAPGARRRLSIESDSESEPLPLNETSDGSKGRRRRHFLLRQKGGRRAAINRTKPTKEEQMRAHIEEIRKTEPPSVKHQGVQQIENRFADFDAHPFVLEDLSEIVEKSVSYHRNQFCKSTTDPPKQPRVAKFLKAADDCASLREVGQKLWELTRREFEPALTVRLAELKHWLDVKKKQQRK